MSKVQVVGELYSFRRVFAHVAVSDFIGPLTSLFF